MKTVGLVFITVLIAVLFLFLVVCVFHRLFPKKAQHWFCEKLGWHDGDGNGASFDGCSIHARCSICGKEVMMDSQGNWF